MSKFIAYLTRRPKYLTDILSRQSNNFDLIRLIAALSVMLAHSYGLQNPTGNVDIVSRFFHGAEYPGSLAVYTFFLLSGILITQSYDKQQNPIRFGVLRLFRIWPGLCVNVVVTVLVVGLFFCNAPDLRSFLLAPGTIQYLLTNTAHIGGVEGFIPGAFPRAITPNGVNFPLWTLPVEVQCYFLVFLVGRLGLYRKPHLFVPVLAGLTVIYLAIASTESTWPFAVYFFHKFSTYSFYPVVFFMVGMALYVFRNHVILRWEIFVALIITYYVLMDSWVSFPLLYVGLAYGVIIVSGLNVLHHIKPKHDYSYGIYIYGFVCQQIVANTWPSMSNYAGLALSVPLAIACAATSWHCIEKPSIDVSRRLTRHWTSEVEGQMAKRPFGGESSEAHYSERASKKPDAA